MYLFCGVGFGEVRCASLWRGNVEACTEERPTGEKEWDSVLIPITFVGDFSRWGWRLCNQG